MRDLVPTLCDRGVVEVTGVVIGLDITNNRLLQAGCGATGRLKKLLRKVGLEPCCWEVRPVFGKHGHTTCFTPMHERYTQVSYFRITVMAERECRKSECRKSERLNALCCVFDRPV